MNKYPTEQLKSWDKAKEIRLDYYKNFATAREKGGLRWAGGAWSFGAIPAGLGDDVYPLTGEPYGASIAWNKDFAVRCQEAAEKYGFARDLCSYMRSYWGSVLLDEYAFGGKFPKPDFMWQDHICCSHAKWYQVASDLEGGIPNFCIDVAVGPENAVTENRINYIVNQMHEGIEWLEKVTKRKYNDEKLIEAVYNECRATSAWAEVCLMNKTVPAPLDEKTMYSLYVLGTLMKHHKIVADYYEELRDEVKDRVKRGIAAVPNERCRVMSDTQPPWAFLKVFRYLEKFGCVSIGSLYTFGLIGLWEVKPDLPAPRPGKFFVYAIKCDDGSIYIGQTENLPRRWEEHMQGEVEWTSSHKPISIVHYEEYNSREEAVKREQDLKTGFGRKWLKEEIEAGRARQAGGTWGAKTTPQQKGIKIKTRDQALRILAEWNLSKPEWQHFYSPALKSDMMVRIGKEWKLDGVMLHYNRGCEGLSLGIAENRLALQKAGFPVMTFEGNMGDEREFDEARTMTRIDTFMETLNLKKLED